MPVTTPTQKIKFEKRCHTPPTIEREKGKSTPTKFLKSLSSNVFKRNSFSKKFESSPEQSPITKFSRTSKTFVRTKTPKPLDLNQPLSPPKTIKKYENLYKSTTSVGSFQSAENMTLYSPATIIPPLSNTRPKNLAHILQEAFESPTISRENSILGDNKSIRSNFLEESSLSHSRNMAKSVTSLKTGKSFKKFVKEKCSICEEEVCYSFSGEKIIELTCSHVCHYDCYLILNEASYETGEQPLCSICHVRSGPKDPEVVQNLVSMILMNKKQNNASANDKIYDVPHSTVDSKQDIGQQYMELKSAKLTDQKLPNFTPIDQIIKTADISYNGFKDKMVDSDNDFKTSEELDSLDTIKERELLSFLESVTYEPLAPPKKIEKLPEVKLVSNVTNGQSHLHIQFPIVNNTNRNLFSELILESDSGQEHEIKASLTKYIKRRFNKAMSFEDLLLFDKVKFSTDGEDWDSNIMCYLFQDILILFDLEEQKVTGKVPMDQISLVTEISEKKLIIDLKSTSLPEIYLEFYDYDADIAKTECNNAKKWKYYLNNLDEIPHLLHVTDNATNEIPSELHKEIENYKATFDSSKIKKPWLNVKLPLRLIVCINLNLDQSDDSGYTVKTYEEQLKQDLHQLMNKLNDDDLLGLIIIGKDGQEYIENRGTFIGMINKTWELWSNIIDSLEVNENMHFKNGEHETNTTLETCYRLISTLPLDDRDNYKNEILFFNKNDTEQKKLMNKIKLKNIMHETIFQKHQFQINEYSMANTGLISDCMDKMNTMKNIKNLKLLIEDTTIHIGDINSEEEQKINLNYYPINVKDIVVCKLTWFDDKTKINNDKILQIMKESDNQ